MTANSNNALFAAFSSQIVRIRAKSPDDKKYCKGIEKFATERVCTFFADVFDAETIKGIKPFAAVLRLGQALSFIAGEHASFELSTAVIVAIVASAKSKTISFTDARYIMGGTGDDNVQPIAGMSRARIATLIGLVNNGTVGTRVSSALGKNGFMTELGITRKSGAHGFDLVKRGHPFIIAYARMLGKVSDRDFDKLLSDTVK